MISKTKIKTKILVNIYHIFMFLNSMTWRKRYFGLEYLERLEEENKNWIYCAWHNNVSSMPWTVFRKRERITVLVSASKDGEMITQALHKLNQSAVRGSSSRGGGRAFIQMLRLIREGNVTAITPDGPRGPCYQLQMGAILLAQKSGRPLIPYHIEADRAWRFPRSWDQHKIPKPFSNVTISIGQPFYISANLNKEELATMQRVFEKKMLENINLSLHT